ncbi:hypothetical protein HF908_08900 [Ralstonia pseudosolanacearum]|uniref:gp53-like domain-containing protein n=1 Tax=Ralstonia pseudosolanacearum TaxID=1310165 RepID=UPI001868AC76|nr:hypothetical protein [Ralstonia pseudosolanacearum]QOK91585.1 hypothetical protein HF908_08900 [Ralstonia pseudosolanacearum]
MKRIATTNAVVDLFGPGKNGFGAGNPAAGVRPTYFSADWCNDIQEEICSLIEAMGMQPDGSSRNMLATAINLFVQSRLGNVRTIYGLSAATVLSATHAGALIGCNAPANYTLTLPAMASLGVVSTIGFFHNNTTGTVTIAGNGTEKIVVGGANQASITLNPGQFIVLSTDLTTGWYVSSGNLRGYTQAVGDNSQNLATTAFLQNTLAQSPGLGGAPTTTNPVANDNSTRIASTGWVWSNILALVNSVIGGVTGVTAAANDNTTKLSTTAWIWNNIQSLVSSCISAVATSAGFASSLGTNGYVKFPSWLGGWIFQWGLTSITANTDASINFPISFTSAVYSITNSNGYTQGSGTINQPVVTGVSPSLSSFVLRSTNGTSVFWMAAGK